MAASRVLLPSWDQSTGTWPEGRRSCPRAVHGVNHEDASPRLKHAREKECGADSLRDGLEAATPPHVRPEYGSLARGTEELWMRAGKVT